MTLKLLVLLKSQLQPCRARTRNKRFGFFYLRNTVVSRESPVLFTCPCDTKATGITHKLARAEVTDRQTGRQAGRQTKYLIPRCACTKGFLYYPYIPHCLIQRIFSIYFMTIHTVGVTKRYRRRGVGHHLMTSLLEHVTTTLSSCWAVYLHVVYTNTPAIGKLLFVCVIIHYVPIYI